MLGIFKDPEKRAILSWLGGGAAIVAGGIWTVATFVVDHKDGHDKPLTEQLGQKDAQIAALIKQNGDLIQNLLKNYPAAGPATRQAVSQAVGSIAEGAAEGDRHLQTALDLLKANKIAEATQILQSVAENDRKNAAVAYRNLGAIAGLGDPKRALDAYEKALVLDPDESLLWVGKLQIDRDDLNQAQARAQHALALATSVDQTPYRCWAMLRIGDIAAGRGNLAGALKAYSDGLAIRDRLAKSDPGNAGWRRDLSVSYNRVGDVRSAQGDLSGALNAYRDGLAIRDRLAKSDPGNAEWQRDLSKSYAYLAYVYRNSGDKAKALHALKQGEPIISRLAKLSPDNVAWKEDLRWFDAQIAELTPEPSRK